MVGLSIVLEAKKGGGSTLNKKSPQVINKFTMKTTQPSSLFTTSFHSSSTSSKLTPSFLDKCFLCRKKLLPGKDIYMYKGDKGFCSEECRCRQIDMDEEDQTAAFMTPKNNTYKVKKTTNCSSYYSASASKTTRNRAFEFAG
ncbi:hypothetical protein DCAR_0832516 [Daucus carota subsp. sativus]|uniref:FLZ-type domain-containing protein n=1 Tax=Daucus carota subsp. sativus TaxID=79200 RepID=A0AAF0XTF0_DAUCS|nr:PREDICTED: uncharacterized protein LOC108197796 [Daucus carota subsp. sativus]WOH13007.1 hypothetical protein DCAR_0832516 [Daucus carota subsp. sativus]